MGTAPREALARLRIGRRRPSAVAGGENCIAGSPPTEEPTLADREDASYQAGPDFDNLQSYHAYHWSLRSPDPPEKVVAFYRNLALPPEEEDLGDDLDEEDGEAPTEVRFELPPGDSDSVSVTIQRKPTKAGGTRFTLRESVLTDRRG